MFNDFFNLIFPKLCSACNKSLVKNEPIICISCQTNLPKTNYHLDIDNPINKIFWGRINIEMAAAFYSFSTKSKVQNLLHQIKYRNNKEAGFFVGKLYGFELRNTNYFKQIDFIIPVPLHQKKLKERGYNQSELIANGLSSSLIAPVITNILYRKIDSATQTKKKRYNRWENVGEIFEIKNIELLKNKNVLLVDDVITTGATLEACAKLLHPHNCNIYIATISCA